MSIDLSLCNKNEQLFWKVFKNIVLFKNITSNFKCSKFLSYDKVYCINRMIKQNLLNLLIDKVNRNQYLIVWENTSLDNASHLWYIEVFLKIRKNEIFYNNLFSNYPHFFINYFQVALHAIRCGNLSALKVLLENHYKISEYWFYVNQQIVDLLLQTVAYARLSEFIFLYELFKFEKRKELKQEFISQFIYIGTIEKHRACKIPKFINYLYNLFGDEIKDKLIPFLRHIKYSYDKLSLIDLIHSCESQLIFKKEILINL